jgi:hypothetical protein
LTAAAAPRRTPSMTPELRQSIAKRARELQGRIRPDGGDAVLLATDARRLFEDAVDELRARWLTLELSGYGGHVAARPLRELLRVAPGDLVGDRLVAHIAAYRTQRGHDVTPGHAREEARHFFVEPLADLMVTAEKLNPPPPAVVLSFGSAQHAPSIEFGGDVFTRILSGFYAALHLQLGDLTR